MQIYALKKSYANSIIKLKKNNKKNLHHHSPFISSRNQKPQIRIFEIPILLKSVLDSESSSTYKSVNEQYKD